MRKTLIAAMLVGLAPLAAAADALWLDPDKTEPAGTRYRPFRSATVRQDVSYLI